MRPRSAIRCIVLFSFAWSAVSLASGEPATGDHVKAAFLYNLTKFVEWPSAGGDPAGEKAIVFGIVGGDGFEVVLSELVEGKLVNGRKVKVVRVEKVQEVQPCHLLFIGSGAGRKMAQFLKAAEGASILTVGDTEGFLEAGGMIQVGFEGKKMQFDANVAAGARASLRISSQVLKLARNVRN